MIKTFHSLATHHLAVTIMFNQYINLFNSLIVEQEHSLRVESNSPTWLNLFKIFTDSNTHVLFIVLGSHNILAEDLALPGCDTMIWVCFFSILKALESFKML
jgi:hypothetical protein